MEAGIVSSEAKYLSKERAEEKGRKATEAFQRRTIDQSLTAAEEKAEMWRATAHLRSSRGNRAHRGEEAEGATAFS